MFNQMQRVLPWVIYPGVISIGLGLFEMLLQKDFSLEISTYGAIIIGTGFIMFFEKVMPYHKSWQPNRDDYKNEMLFLTIVQVLIPQLITLTVLFSFYDSLQAWLPSLNSIWPHQLSPVLQFVLLLFLVDFMRYWLHRLAHTNSLLWRLHAVHHSTQKMFWLNTVRFHPLEKVIQLIFDSIPFLLLGVDASVLALYYVFYALNGFFQHSNIYLKLGWLNYIVSSALLHRWHHSSNPVESNSNYGNNLIVWDILFGSFYLPDDRQVKQLGLINRNYPLDFVTQLKAPFIDQLDKHEEYMPSWREILHFQLISIIAVFIYILYWLPLIFHSYYPQAKQYRVLKKIIQTNKSTLYGQERGFNQIHCYSDFAQRVPVNEYENLRDLIEQQSSTAESIISEDPAVLYSLTSGTTNKPKLIPICLKGIKRLKKEQEKFSLNIFRACPQAFMGKMLTITSSEVEGHTENGTHYGSASGLINRLTPSILKCLDSTNKCIAWNSRKNGQSPVG